jgi:RNA polymerase sigma-70 factor (ECF subfamily)
MDAQMLESVYEESPMCDPKRAPTFDEYGLVKEAAAGNLDAFNRLVLHYQNLAYSHAYALLGDSDSAEDATQESFIKAFQSINSYRGGSFRSWLLKIVTNSAYDMMRRARRHPNQSLYPLDENGEEMESVSWLVDPSPSVENAAEQNQLSSQIYKLLDQLPAAYRSVITLIDINELDYVEAAKVLRVPIGTVKSRLARARLQMREKISQCFDRSESILVRREA